MSACLFIFVRIPFPHELQQLRELTKFRAPALCAGTECKRVDYKIEAEIEAESCATSDVNLLGCSEKKWR